MATADELILFSFVTALVLFWPFYRLFNAVENSKTYRKILHLMGSLGMAIALGTASFWFLTDISSPKQISEGVYMNILTVVLLYLTWVGALWLARETFDQKKIATKTIKELREQNYYEMRPYLRLQWTGTEDAVLEIVNDGRGMALDVVFDRLNFDDGGFLTPIQIKSRPLIRSGGTSQVSRKELVNLEESTHPELKDRSMVRFLDLKIRYGFPIRCTYKDLVGNSYEAIFISDENYNDRYRIQRQERLTLNDNVA